jgi:hypothetical protein
LSVLLVEYEEIFVLRHRMNETFFVLEQMEGLDLEMLRWSHNENANENKNKNEKAKAKAKEKKRKREKEKERQFSHHQ